MAVSVLILTLNEESNLRDCLGSLAWSDDIVVLDSHSSDRTTEIAISLGARVVQRRFDNWAAHQNWAVQNIQFKNPWVLYLDADERCTPELRNEIFVMALPNATQSAFRIRRKDMLMGTWLRHAQLYPTWFVRLFRPEKIRYERLVNPVAIVGGAVGQLQEHIIHYPFSHGIGHWIDRHNKYSDFEAQEALLAERSATANSHGLWSRDPVMRRRALKDFFFRLPARPLIKFFYYYFWRRGFLDGRAGLTYSGLQAFYEYMITCKQLEQRRRAAGLPI